MYASLIVLFIPIYWASPLYIVVHQIASKKQGSSEKNERLLHQSSKKE